MRHTIAVCLLFSAAFLTAQNPTLAKYKVLKVDVRRDVTAVNEAADQGYRLLFSYRFAVMRLDTVPPDTYRYLPIPEGRGRSSLLNALNQQGALGYRIVAEKGVLEKEPHPHNYEYRGAEGFTRNARNSSYASLQMMGFQPISDLSSEQLVVREIGEEHPAPRPKPVRVIDAIRQSKLLEHMAELAAEGYRYRGPQFSEKGGGHAVAMEICESTCGGPFEYRSFDVDTAPQLERDLNKLGSEGFHVVPRSMDFAPHVAERPANHTQTFTYRVIDASDEAVLAKELNQADLDGFVPLGGAAHVGWSVRVFMVLEKLTSATP